MRTHTHTETHTHLGQLGKLSRPGVSNGADVQDLPLLKEKGKTITVNTFIIIGIIVISFTVRNGFRHLHHPDQLHRRHRQHVPGWTRGCFCLSEGPLGVLPFTGGNSINTLSIKLKGLGPLNQTVLSLNLCSLLLPRLPFWKMHLGLSENK